MAESALGQVVKGSSQNGMDMLEQSLEIMDNLIGREQGEKQPGPGHIGFGPHRNKVSTGR
jgi:hypothetical protein